MKKKTRTTKKRTRRTRRIGGMNSALLALKGLKHSNNAREHGENQANAKHSSDALTAWIQKAETQTHQQQTETQTHQRQNEDMERQIIAERLRLETSPNGVKEILEVLRNPNTDVNYIYSDGKVILDKAIDVSSMNAFNATIAMPLISNETLFHSINYINELQRRNPTQTEMKHILDSRIAKII